MNRSLTFISAVLLNGVLSHSQTFKNSIEDANGRAIANTADGGFVLAGINWTHSVTGDMYLVRTNANGEVQWSRTFGGSERDYCAAVEETNDGGSMMVGSTESFGALGRDVYVVKTNTTGNVLWSRTYGGPYDDDGSAMVLTSDGGAIIAGTAVTTSDPSTGASAYVIRIDASGDTLWTNTYDTGSGNGASWICPASGGGYLISGTMGLTSPLINGMMLIRIDDNGIVVWSKTTDTLLADAFSCASTSDGGFIVAGRVGVAACLLRLSSDGDLMWSNMYYKQNCSNKAYSVRELADGGFVFSGDTDLHAWLVRTDASGELVWQYTYAETYKNYNQVVITNNGGFAVGGEIVEPTVQGMLHLRTDADGSTTCLPKTPPIIVEIPAFALSAPLVSVGSFGAVRIPNTVVGEGSERVELCPTFTGTQDIESTQRISLFPNPVTNEFTIKAELNVIALEIVDHTGRMVRIVNWIHGQNKVDVNELSPGHYLLRMIHREGSSIASFVKE
ncbi:MAG: T9SS type A sorting domain-containing protein [Flavobacteriales bacterium]|nr:T9SS type A sorting domain-containing protein [Flavobacteriales bacterium]MBK9534167.1 T9SS type A sorting domain-containing protein [Flavobacteriales bacterium]HQX31110.1 T9SS type A sorting domain-containing protein [Flavobacteriales bacterium]HQZ94579.1 T9SS type A sorting domain-containing protein [Flavobacteriales bacterium]